LASYDSKWVRVKAGDKTKWWIRMKAKVDIFNG
jgi:hypothetical protein